MKELNKQAREIADHFGLDHQLSIAQEECAELIQAISKLRRAGTWPQETPEGRETYTKARYLVSEEMADVWNLLIQLSHLLENETIVAEYLKHKLARTMRKIKEENHAETRP
jgi:NTP pyrophosphatase (non-canonical NTP hydrolase)